ncbi:MAG: YeeE/YedE family protein [Myxococcales bacterium]|nr:YeeE/YedE family protein [Myxococcales bacterium]
MKTTLVLGAGGLLLGFSLSRIGFTDYGELHGMFIFADLRMLWVFAGAMGLCMLGFLLIDRRLFRPTRRVHPGVVPGGILFGAGWALCGACPVVPLVQLGEGKLAALFTLLGVAVGTLLYRPLHARIFRWDTGTCDS